MSDSTVGIRINDFRPIGEGALDLHAALKGEVERASGFATATWATLRDYGLFPLNEAALLEHPELASIIEPSGRASVALRRRGRLAVPFSLRELLRDATVTLDPVLEAWRASLQVRRTVAAPYGARQLAGFFRAVESHRGGARYALPRYRVWETGAWRAFAAMYPYAALPLLGNAIRSARPADTIFASAVLPVLAHAESAEIRAQAHDALEPLKDLASEEWLGFEGYRWQRELNRGLAESGLRDYLERAIRVIRSPDSLPYERRHLHSYGWTDDVIQANLGRKLNEPALRDEALIPFYEAMSKLLLA